jgi:ribonuclease VapC
MIVVDSSAVIAMLFREPSSDVLAARLAVDSERVMSVASYLEAGTVLAGRRRHDRPKAIDDLDAFLRKPGLTSKLSTWRKGD